MQNSSPSLPTGQQRSRRAPALSPSRANDYQQCPLLFRFRTVDRLPEPPSSAAVRGTLVHSVLERLFDYPAVDRTVDVAAQLLPAEWEKLKHARPEYTDLFADDAELSTWLGAAGHLVDTYFTLEDPTRLEPSSRELFVETHLDGGPLLRGIVDRVDTAPDGALRVVDYKTGRAPKPQYSAAATFQMRFYGLVMWRSRGEIPRMLQLVYLGDGQVLRNVPTEEELLNTEYKIHRLWDSITADAQSGDWRPKKSKLCGWCSFQHLCPAFGNVAPPIPDGAIQLNLGIA